MPSPPPQPRTLSSSPRTIHGKRKRKTLSCYQCRRRKLKCDREQPSCGRCIEGGYPETCSYVYDASSSQNGARRSTPALSSALKLPSHDAFSRGVPSSAKYSPGSYSPRVAYQFLELAAEPDAPSSLQAHQNQGTWQLLGQTSAGAEARPNIRADTVDDFASNLKEKMPKETVIFRGENFRTHYFGGSNTTSSIAHVSH